MSLNSLNEDKLMRVSPESSGLRSWLKLPMILLVLGSAMQSGISIVMLKLVGELIQSGSGREYWLLVIILVFLLLLSGSL